MSSAVRERGRPVAEEILSAVPENRPRPAAASFPVRAQPEGGFQVRHRRVPAQLLQGLDRGRQNLQVFCRQHQIDHCPEHNPGLLI